MIGKTFRPEMTEEQRRRVPPGQYVTEKFPVPHYGPVPRVNAGSGLDGTNNVRVLMRRQLPAAMLATALLLAACQAAPSAEPGGELSYLFSQTADLGRLEPRAGDDAYTLVLTGVDPHTVQFTDRPARRADVIPTTTFVAAWGALFGDESPNAALVEHTSGTTDTLVLTLSDPAYDAAAAELRYAVVILADEQHPERLVGIGGERHPEPRTAFGAVSLFIDNAATPPSTSCVPGPGAQCSGADLSGRDLSNKDLSGAVFSGANLSGANLSGANLSGANLWGANLSNATASYANLAQANLYYANLAGANLSPSVDLRGADLRGATAPQYLQLANLSGADLRGINLSWTSLNGAVFTGANLAGATLSGMRIDGAGFSEADLTGASFAGSNLQSVYLASAKLSGATLAGATLQGTNFSGADLSNADLSNTDISGADLPGAVLGGADLSNSVLFSTDLSKADLRGADLSLAILVNTNLLGANVGGALLLTKLMCWVTLPDGSVFGGDRENCSGWFDSTPPP